MKKNRLLPIPTLLTLLCAGLLTLASCSPSESTGNTGVQGQGQTPGQGQGFNRQAGQGGQGGTGQQGQAQGAQGGGTRQGGFGGGGGFGGFGQGGNRRGAVITVEVQTTHQGPLAVDNTAAGAVIPDTQSSVAAGSSGTVKTLLRKAGDWVDAGDPIIQLDDSQLKLSVRLAQATLENAKINAGVSDNGGATGSTSKLGLQLQSAQSALASAEKNWASAQALNKIQGISGSDYDNAQVQLQNAQANLESAKMSLQQNGLQVETASIQLQQAQLNLANATIKAPYAGQISIINVHPGEFVGQSTSVFGLVSREKVISFSVAPGDAPGLNTGTPVKFTYGGTTVSTRITQVPAAPLNGLVTLTAALPASMAAPLGTVGTIAYSVVLAQGMLVPLAALQSAENKTYVYTNENNKAARYEVNVLAESGTMVAVTGLTGTPSVILNPPPGLLVGAALQAVAAADPNAGTGTAATTPQGGAGGFGGAGGYSGQRQRGNYTGAGGAAGAGGATGAGTAGAAGTGGSGYSGQRQRGAGGFGGFGGGTGGTGTAATDGTGSQTTPDPNAVPGSSGFSGQRRRQTPGAATTTTGGQ